MAVLRRSKVAELVAKRQKTLASRLSHVDKKPVATSKAAEEQKMASKMLMQGTKARTRKVFRPVHLFGGEFAKQEGAREHKRSAEQELSHLTKLNNEIFGAAPKTAWKVQTADQELASFGALNSRVVGTKKVCFSTVWGCLLERVQTAVDTSMQVWTRLCGCRWHIDGYTRRYYIVVSICIYDLYVIHVYIPVYTCIYILIMLIVTFIITLGETL